MTSKPYPQSPVYTMIDVSSQQGQKSPAGPPSNNPDLRELAGLMHQMVAAQNKSNELMQELVSQLTAPQRQKVNELNAWKEANPRLANSCRQAAKAMSEIQTDYLESLTEEIDNNFENMRDGEFMLNEFVDKFGPRMSHMNGIIQVLSQLAFVPNPSGGKTR
jgi:hypothetical protein